MSEATAEVTDALALAAQYRTAYAGATRKPPFVHALLALAARVEEGGHNAASEAGEATAHPDTVRLDWLSWQVVSVRSATRDGSLDVFGAKPRYEEIDDEIKPSDLRARVDEYRARDRAALPMYPFTKVEHGQ